MTSPRRFPPPWSAEELQACFVVKDSAGQKLAYVYFAIGDEIAVPARRAPRDPRLGRRACGSPSRA